MDLNKVFNHIEEAIVVITVDGSILLLNNSAEKFPYFKEAPLQAGLQLLDIISMEWRDLARQFAENMVVSKIPATVEVAQCDADGKRVYFEIKCTPIMDDLECVKQIVIEIRDITLQKIFEKKITNIANELRSLIENANAVIIGIDCRGYVTEWNETCHRITGYSKNESFTCLLSDVLLDREASMPFSCAMSDVLNGSAIMNYELTIRAKDQRKLTFLINATPRKNADGQVIGILLVGQDITELYEYRKTLEQKVNERTEALQAALRKEKALVEIKNRFVSIASHEFRTPLSSIHFAAESLKVNLEQPDPTEMLVRLNGIQSRVKHMSVLLEDVLTIGKDYADKMTPKLDPVDLKSFLINIIEDVENNTKNTHRVILDLDQPRLVIQTDEKLLRNIFINLLNNAIKFSPGKKEVFLSVKIAEAAVLISIRDIGIGICGKDMQRVFQPFNRGNNVGQIPGTGLGLSIVKKAVEILEGKLTVESEIDRGTMFTIQLNLKNND